MVQFRLVKGIKRVWKIPALAVVLLLGGLLAACAPSGGKSAPKEKIILAVQPTATPQKLAADARDVEKFLEAKLLEQMDIALVAVEVTLKGYCPACWHQKIGGGAMH